MGAHHDRITWLALMMIDDAAEQAEKDWIIGSVGLRLALAYLCSIADGPTFSLPSRRHIFDEFWIVVTRRQAGNPESARYARCAMMTSCLQQIGRQLELGENIFNEVRRARTASNSRACLAEALRPD